MDPDHPSLGHLAVAVFAGTTLRYLVFAGLAWVLGYRWFVRRWRHRKIIPAMPRAEDVRHELGWSAVTLLIFGVIGTATLWLGSQGWNQIYWSVDERGWTWFALSIAAAIVLHDTYFYWTHRLMHHPRLFRRIHLTHHHSRNPTPWASYAFSPLEAIIEAGIFPLVALVIPMHPLAIGLFLLWQVVFNVTGHCGYEVYPAWLMRTWLGKVLNTPTNHVMHHEKAVGNYGIYFNVWDRWMGTNQDAYEERFLRVTSAVRTT